ncbi:MAG: MlaD family protein [Pseudomonadota bacterium]
MNEPSLPEPSPAIVKSKRGISWAWLLPIIAAIIGSFLFYDAWSNRGIEIVVEFDDAEGIEEKRTLVKYRNVQVGRVESIKFAEDGESIRCFITIDAEMRRFLKIDSQFWVVRPRIGAGGISGVNTLLSGAYITLQPGEEETLTDAFVGLNTPPIASPKEAGLKLTLISEGGKTLNVGNPVLYRGLEVGVVESIDFGVYMRKIQYGVFIRAPYDELITSNTYFWNASGVTVSTTVDGIQVDMASIESLVAGGVSFDVPDDLPIGDRIEQSQNFMLYPNELATYEARQYEHISYAILVQNSVGGLVAGAPVEYRGIPIGRVETPYLGFYETFEIDPEESRIPVIINIEPGRLTQNPEYDLAWFSNQFNIWIRGGLEAKIELANFITGSLKVSLDNSGIERDSVETFGNYPVIPFAEEGIDSILSKTNTLLTKLNALPIDDLLENTDMAVNNANEAIDSAKVTLNAIQDLVIDIEETLTEANETFQTMQPDSEVHDKLIRNLDELQRTMMVLQPVLSDIKQKPNSLVFGQALPADKTPKVKQ